jgi:cell cycle arrest protein BUB2
MQLVDETLQLFDPELTQHLNKHKLDCVLYGFSCTLPSFRLALILKLGLCSMWSGVLSLSSPAPPFEELMVLWDFLFAYGVHWNVLAVVAQVLLIREQVLASDTYDSMFLITF